MGLFITLFYLNILFVTYVHLCGPVWIYVFYIPAYEGRSQKVVRSSGTGVIGACETSDMDAGNQSWVLRKAENAFMRDQKEMLLTAETSLQ